MNIKTAINEKILARDIEAGHARGYWLIDETTGARHWLGKNVSESQNTICNVLERNGITEWWIDFCLGLDVKGAPAWCNIDQTDAIMP